MFAFNFNFYKSNTKMGFSLGIFHKLCHGLKVGEIKDIVTTVYNIYYEDT